MRRGLAIAAALTALASVTGSPARDDFDRTGLPGVTPSSDAEANRTCSKGPLDRPRPGCSPAPPPSTGNPYEDCVARINQLRRKCQCLPPLERWKGGEACANKHAKYDAKHGIHAGFNSKVCKPHGRAQNECPSWPSAERVVEGCLQRMWDEGPGRRFSKHGHYLNMSSLEYESVACGFAKDANGEVWSVQNFR